MKKILRSFLSAMFALSLFTSLSYADIPEGVSWLESNIGVDGSYGLDTDIATNIQATSEVIETFDALSTAIPDIAYDYIQAEEYEGTEYLSRKIIAGLIKGEDVSSFLNDISNSQNSDGGFGEFAAYNSTPLDTGFSLKALALQPGFNVTIISQALWYLQSQQSDNGGFTLPSISANSDSVYITSAVLQALGYLKQSFNVSTEIDKSVDFLLTSLHLEGVWIDDWKIANALLSIIPVSADSVRYQDAVDHLTSQQLANGSWGNDVYTTALALRAVNLADTIEFPVPVTTGTIQGRLVDSENLQSISGATVSISEISINEITGESGEFLLSDIEPGEYTVIYTAEGYLDATQQVTVSVNQVSAVGTIALQRIPTTSILMGVITDATSGLPLSGATIQVTGLTNYSVVSNAIGEYSIVVEPGDYQLESSAQDYDTITAGVQISVGIIVNFSPAMYPVGTTPVQDSIVSGTILDGETNLPLADVLIDIAGATTVSTLTNSAGFFQEIVSTGTISVSASLNGYDTVSGSALIGVGQSVDFSPSLYPENTTPVTLAVISGVVTSEETGLGIDSEIEITGATQINIVSQPDGSYFAELEAGQNEISVSASGYDSANVSVLANNGDSFDFSPALYAANETPTVTTLIGRVLDSNTQLPVEGVYVVIDSDQNKSTETDNEGRFALANVSVQGSLNLTFSKAGYFEYSGDVAAVPINPMNIGDVEISMIPVNAGSTMYGTITDQVNDAPIQNARVLIEGQGIFAYTDNQGKYTLPGILNETDGQGVDLGGFHVLVSVDGYRSSIERITAEEQSEINRDYQLLAAIQGEIVINNLTTDAEQYSAYRTILVTGSFENTDDEAIVLVPTFELVDQFGSVVIFQNGESNTAEQITVLPSDSIGFSTNFYTSTYSPGLYQVRVKAYDSGGALLVQSSEYVEIISDASLENVSVDLSPKFALATQDVEVALLLKFSNRANIDRSISIELNWFDTNNGVFRSSQIELPISKDNVVNEIELDQFIKNFDTSGLYVAKLTILDQLETLTLESSIQILPLTRIEPSQSISPMIIPPGADKDIGIGIHLEGGAQ